MGDPSVVMKVIKERFAPTPTKSKGKTKIKTKGKNNGSGQQCPLYTRPTVAVEFGCNHAPGFRISLNRSSPSFLDKLLA